MKGAERADEPPDDYFSFSEFGLSRPDSTSALAVSFSAAGSRQIKQDAAAKGADNAISIQQRSHTGRKYWTWMCQVAGNRTQNV